MALAHRQSQPRVQARGMVVKAAAVVVLCVAVAATVYQSNQSLLAGASLSVLRSKVAYSDSSFNLDSDGSNSATLSAEDQRGIQGDDADSDSPLGTSDTTGAEPASKQEGQADSKSDSTQDAEGSSSDSDRGTVMSDDAGGTAKPLRFFDAGHAYHHSPVCPPGWDRPGFTCDASPCPVPWEYTEDRGQADAVIYNTLDGMAGWGEVNVRPPGQWAVMFAMESGQYYPTIYTAKDEGANITADYRLDSDVPVTYYTRWEYPDLREMPVPFAEKRTDGLIAVFISNCGPKNDREQVLAKLIELLPGQVHSYGGCQHNKDANDSKFATFSTYKFAFTPENSNDPGYVTEKVYHALKAGTVPIYIGAPDIHKFVPVPEAVIRVADFKSIDDLVVYLKKAAADDKTYNKHIAWKQKPESEWSDDWKSLERLTQYSAHCRIAMHIAGKPHQWKQAR